MPKIIPNIRSRILQSARRQLAEGGYPSLSLRGVAKDCGIALGTTYHYFQNKQDLAIEVLREDWNNEVIAEIQIDPSTMAPEDVSVKFYSLLGKFCSKYNHALRPSGILPVYLPYTTLLVMVRMDVVGSLFRYV